MMNSMGNTTSITSSNHSSRQSGVYCAPQNCTDIKYGVDEFTEDNIVKRPSTAFTVYLDDEQKDSKPRSRTAPVRHSKAKQDAPLVDYTGDESRLMAEIVRESRINDVREKAKYIDVKLYDAKRRRMFQDYRKEQLQKQETERRTADAIERRKLVKQMADETRKKASKDRLFKSASGRNSDFGTCSDQL